MEIDWEKLMVTIGEKVAYYFGFSAVAILEGETRIGTMIYNNHSELCSYLINSSSGRGSAW